MNKKILTYLTLTTLLFSCDYSERFVNATEKIRPITQHVQYNNGDKTALLLALNSDDRITDNKSWKTNVESNFDVDNFLKWMAAKNIVENWDTEKDITYNYYLYNNPEAGLLSWIPWEDKDLTYNGITVSWPLVKHLISDLQYKDSYDSYAKEFIDEIFIADEMQDKYSGYYNLITSFLKDKK